MTTVLITGANGFIARSLAPLLRREGDRVVGVARRAQAIDGYDRVYAASLGEPLNDVFAAESPGVLVHCANHSGANEFDVNVTGTSLWMEEARARGATLQVFLSSLSAQFPAASDYARAKYELERRFIALNEVVLRPALVVGDGGLFGRMRRSIETSPIVPLLDNGSTPVYLVGVDTLCAIIRDCIRAGGEGFRGRAWHTFQPAPHTIRDVSEGIRRYSRRRCWFVAVPSLPVLWAFALIDKIPFLRLPINSNNVRGIRQSRDTAAHSDYDHFGYPLRSLDALIADTVQR